MALTSGVHVKSDNCEKRLTLSEIILAPLKGSEQLSLILSHLMQF